MYNLFSGLDFFKPWKLVEYVRFYQASVSSGGGGAGSSSNGTGGTRAGNPSGGAGGTGNPGAGGGQGAGAGASGLPSTAQQYGGGGGGSTSTNSRNAGAQGYVLITYFATPMNASGPISLGGTGTIGDSVNLRLGNSATATISMNDAAVRTLTGTTAGTAIIMPTNFYGK